MLIKSAIIRTLTTHLLFHRKKMTPESQLVNDKSTRAAPILLPQDHMLAINMNVKNGTVSCLNHLYT